MKTTTEAKTKKYAQGNKKDCKQKQNNKIKSQTKKKRNTGTNGNFLPKASRGLWKIYLTIDRTVGINPYEFPIQ